MLPIRGTVKEVIEDQGNEEMNKEVEVEEDSGEDKMDYQIEFDSIDWESLDELLSQPLPIRPTYERKIRSKGLSAVVGLNVKADGVKHTLPVRPSKVPRTMKTSIYKPGR